MSKFKAIIFDMDGVLIDSEIHWLDVEKEFFGVHSLEFTKDMQSYMQGRSEGETVIWLKKEFGWSDTLEEITEQRRKMSEKIYTEKCQPLPGVVDVIKMIKGAGLQTAIVSSTSLQRINVIVNRFNWEKYFDYKISAEGKEMPGKPAPDIYIFASKILEKDPTNCLVFEDSLNGIRSAKSAGMSCIAICDPRWSKLTETEADITVSGFDNKEINNFIGI